MQVHEKPFIHLYRSAREYYFYDVNKDSIVTINQNIYNYLDEKINFDELSIDDKQYIEKLLEDGYLSNKHFTEIRHPMTDKIRNILDGHCKQLILQVTQSCNLICSYCPYAAKTNNVLQRDHSNRSMNWEIAKKSIDFFAEHSKFNQEVNISFYGGEPLIAFELIKKCVAYCKKLFLGKHCIFNMTTNGTLFTDEMIAYLSENHFEVMFSIDGPASVHDINRKKIDHSGSFSSMFNNLKKLYSAYSEQDRQLIHANMVLSPDNDLDDVYSLFDDPFIKETGLHFDVVVADDQFLTERLEFPDEFRSKFKYYDFLSLISELKLIDGLQLPPFYKNLMLRLKHNYIQYKHGRVYMPDTGAPGGPCVPGLNRLFVTVTGDFFSCERVSEVSDCMCIGNVNDGFDYEKTGRLLNVAQDTAEKCKNCYAIHHCTLCQSYSDDQGVLSGKKRMSHCPSSYSNIDNEIMKCILLKEAKTVYSWRS
jgi:uncharacterized protein